MAGKIDLREVSKPIGVPVWVDTAGSCPKTERLSGDVTADVAIIGGGYTGLSAAIRLAGAGTSVVLVEAGDIGAGASGRNGGQINPGLKLDPDDVVAHYGPAAETALQFAGAAPDVVFELIRQFGIQCEARRSGWLMPAHLSSALPMLERRAAAWQKRGVDVRIHDRPATEALTGSRSYAGSIVDPRGGNLQPMSYVYGLARAAIDSGVRIFTCTTAKSLRAQQRSWIIETNAGQVKSTQAILATNAYADGLWPQLRETILPINSYQIATAPLPGGVGEAILPNGHHAADTRHLIRYFRKDPRGRLLVGGQGKPREPLCAADFSHVYRALCSMYPEVRGTPIEYAWSGRVAVTPDYFPHVHEPAQGLIIALGYNGRGVALATAMGRAIADRVLNNGNILPIPATPIKPIPFYGLHQLYEAVATAYLNLLDRR